jgi:transposase
MSNPYSEDIRLRVVHAVESCNTTREVSAIFLVSSSFVSNIHQRWQRTGHVRPKQIDGYRRALLEPYEDALKAQLTAHPSMTLSESKQGLTLSLSAIDQFVRQKLGYRYKKTVFASEQQRDDVAAAWEQWQTWQQSCDLSKLVFLDETSTSTELIRRYGRALAGTRCRDAAPAGHWQSLTFIAGLRVD